MNSWFEYVSGAKHRSTKYLLKNTTETHPLWLRPQPLFTKFDPSNTLGAQLELTRASMKVWVARWPLSLSVLAPHIELRVVASSRWHQGIVGRTWSGRLSVNRCIQLAPAIEALCTSDCNFQFGATGEFFWKRGHLGCNRTNELVLIHSNADTGITRHCKSRVTHTHKLVKHTATRMFACCNSKTTPQKHMFYYFCISRCETTPHNSHSPSHHKSTPDRHTH